MDYLAQLADNSTLFAKALDSVARDVAVPTCPDWLADDLVWHLAEVQWFWAAIVRDRVSDPAELNGRRTERPLEMNALRELGRQRSTELVTVLRAASPSDHAWTWADDHTVGFIIRRQAHEALIHRVDAQIVAGSRTPMDARLSSDGVDEVLRVMFASVPAGATQSPEEGAVRITAVDTEHSWVVTPARLIGREADGTGYDEPSLVVAETDAGDDVVATVTGAAADLDCWLWGRPPSGPLERAGDQAALARLDTVVASGLG